MWHGDMPVSWEGPAVYRCQVTVGPNSRWMVFHGVSYLAEVFVDRILVAEHRGIWDAFTIDLGKYLHQTVNIEIRVTKNGGIRFPVKDVTSGFIPYVYHTFGGIFRPVEMCGDPPLLDPPAPPSRIDVRGGRIFADGKPFYARGILTWGWYPDTANPTPSQDAINQEIDKIQSFGFNLVKFCLWLPPHNYLEELDRRGMWAWLELPIWLPNPDEFPAMEEECLRIVSQYRRHPNILAWTAGCELSEGIRPDWRERFVRSIQEATGHPLVKDNSGGAEMYGGHPAEFGTFEDFHPYCEPMDYPGVLSALAPGPRPKLPALLGEFNDYDIFRPAHLMVENPPYWASPDPDLNEQGVRWQHDLPRIVAECRDTGLGDWLTENSAQLAENSMLQAEWMRQQAFDATRLQPWIDGWVLTGHRHTPISTAGVIDDNAQPVFPMETVRNWTADTSLMLFPRRVPPWVHGGNRAGFEHPTVRFAGPCQFLVATHTTTECTARLRWKVTNGAIGECPTVEIQPLEPTEVGRFTVDLIPGRYQLDLQFGATARSYSLTVVEPCQPFDTDFITRPTRTVARPFFREACLQYQDPAWAETGWQNDFDRLALVAPDQAIDPNCLQPNDEILLTRLDTRTFERLPYVVRSNGKIITTLMPEHPRGYQPPDLSKNPAAHDFARLVARLKGIV